MLIFLVCLNVLALSFFLMWCGKEKNSEEIDTGGFVLCVITFCVLFILIIVLIDSGISHSKKAKQFNIDYKNLKYYVVHKEDYKERSLIEAINEYNVELKDFHAKQSSPWLNWFYPGDLSECEYIVLEDK